MADRRIRLLIEGQEILACPERTTVIEAARLMKQRHVGAMMVVENGKLIGIFTERDALMRVLAEARDPLNTPMYDVMTRNPQVIHPDKLFAEALRIMHNGGFRHVPVVEEGRPIGMVSAGDAMGPELENFVTELLRDEQIGDVLA
jgi:CBS domain-containing protein